MAGIEKGVHIDIYINDDNMNNIEQDVDRIEQAESAPTPMPIGPTPTSTAVDLTSSIKQKKRTRKERSKCWNHFEKLPLGKDGTQKCRCTYCRKEFTCAVGGGTGHLLRHMNKCLKKDTRDIGQMLLSSSHGTIGLTDTSFDHDKFRELLAAAMTMHNLPFKFVEYPGIRACFEYMRPDIQHISRNTAKADMLKLYELEKKKIESMLSRNSSRVSLTSDLWTAINSDGYLAITVHFIDESWILRRYILCLSYMPSPHTGAALAEKIFALLFEWGIHLKLASLTLDNASANDVCVTYLKAKLASRTALISGGDLFHIRCCAHILNLIVQEGLKHIDYVVEKVRESIRYIRGSQSRKEKFIECVKSLCLDSRKGLRQDVPTRWNSTFLMLKSALYYKTAFEHLGMSDTGYIHCPTVPEWERIEKLYKFLGPYYDLTCLFSGTKYPTSNLFFPYVVVIYHNLKDECVSNDDSLKRMATQMIGKFEKYWSSFNEMLAMAVVLDPRYKLNFVGWAYRRLYGHDDAQVHLDNFRKKLFDIFDEYSRCSSFASSSSSNTQVHINVKSQTQTGIECQYFFTV